MMCRFVLLPPAAGQLKRKRARHLAATNAGAVNATSNTHTKGNGAGGGAGAGGGGGGGGGKPERTRIESPQEGQRGAAEFVYKVRY